MSAPRVRRSAPLALPAPPPDRGPLRTAEEIAALLGVSPAWVRRSVRAGRVKLGQRTIRWYEREVLAWVASRAEVPDGSLTS